MKTLQSMTKDERSLLLFFETRAVDYAGKVQTAHMNADDFKIAQRWDSEGFVNFGRIAFEDVNSHGSHWCRLSDDAWALAHEERQARACRTWRRRSWRTTEEKRVAA